MQHVTASVRQSLLPGKQSWCSSWGKGRGLLDGDDDPSGKRRRRGSRRGKELVIGLVVLMGVVYILSSLLSSIETGINVPQAAWARPGEPSLQLQRFPATATPRPDRLLIATHSRLMWFYYKTREVKILHEGQGEVFLFDGYGFKGIYYGSFPGHETNDMGGPTTLWVISRPHNWRPKNSDEWLIQLDMQSGEELKRVKIKSKFTHDAIRIQDRVFVASTGTGQVLELIYPSMKLKQAHELFTEQQHINTLSPVLGSPGKLWAMLHMKGPSQIVEVDFTHAGNAHSVLHVDKVGAMSHGLVHWRDALLLLDSQSAALMAVDPTTSLRHKIWQAEEEVLPFLKGLAVVDDIAYLGVSQPSRRSQRNDPTLNSEVAAIDLITGKELWRMEMDISESMSVAVQLPTHGLLNAISAPHLAVGSGYHANFLTTVDDGRSVGQVIADREAAEARLRHAGAQEALGEESVLSSGDGAAVKMEPASGDEAEQRGDDSRMKEQVLQAARGPDIHWSMAAEPAKPFLGGHWASGFPYISLTKKKTGLYNVASILPLLHLNVTDFRDAVLREPDSMWTKEEQKKSNAWLEGREGNMEAIKPGVQSIHLIFSDGDITERKTESYQFPYYKRYSRYLDQILDVVLGKDKHNILRLQLARMTPGSVINHHQDDGSWVTKGHRIHVPLASPAGVEFHICGREGEGTRGECSRLRYHEGDVFELNNRRMHYLKNEGSQQRVHLVIDVLQRAVKRTELMPGQICHYESKRIVC